MGPPVRDGSVSHGCLGRNSRDRPGQRRPRSRRSSRKTAHTSATRRVRAEWTARRSSDRRRRSQFQRRPNIHDAIQPVHQLLSSGVPLPKYSPPLFEVTKELFDAHRGCESPMMSFARPDPAATFMTGGRTSKPIERPDQAEPQRALRRTRDVRDPLWPRRPPERFASR